MSPVLPASRLRRIWRKRGEEGAVSIVELLVTVVIASLVLAAAGGILYSAQQTSGTIVGTLASSQQVEQDSAVAVRDLGNALPLGACSTDAPGSYATPWNNCAQPVFSGPSLGLAQANAMCFFSYPQTQASATNPSEPAPNVKCLAVVPLTGNSAEDLWLLSLSPVTGATSTNCNPTNGACWVDGQALGGGLFTSGSFSASALQASCTTANDCSALLVGQLSAADPNPFVYYTAGSAAQPDPPVSEYPTLALVGMTLSFNARPVQPGTAPSNLPHQFVLHYAVALRGTVLENQQAWNGLA